MKSRISISFDVEHDCAPDELSQELLSATKENYYILPESIRDAIHEGDMGINVIGFFAAKIDYTYPKQ